MTTLIVMAAHSDQLLLVPFTRILKAYTLKEQLLSHTKSQNTEPTSRGCTSGSSMRKSFTLPGSYYLYWQLGRDAGILCLRRGSVGTGMYASSAIRLPVRKGLLS